MKMMKLLLFGVLSLAMLMVSADAFNDPMRPPDFALKKYRAEKFKQKKTVLPSKSTPKKQATWTLTSILFSKQRQHAIINNQLVKQGDVIKGAKLVRLRPDSVRLLSNGRTIDLSLREKLTTLKKSPIEKKYERNK